MKWKLPGGLCGGEWMKEAGSGRRAVLSFRRTRAGWECEPECEWGWGWDEGEEAEAEALEGPAGRGTSRVLRGCV